MRAGRCPGDKENPQFHVSDLTPGQDYKFRVTAVNDEGDSEPLETEGAIKAKTRTVSEWRLLGSMNSWA